MQHSSCSGYSRRRIRSGVVTRCAPGVWREARLVEPDPTADFDGIEMLARARLQGVRAGVL